jgi:hypothetical protein
MDFSGTAGWRLSRLGRFVGGFAILSLGCATSAPPPNDRFSPAQMKNGPSLYETGRFGTVPLSNAGLTVDGGSIDPHPHRVAPAAAARVSSARPTMGGGHRSPAKQRKPQPRVEP